MMTERERAASVLRRLFDYAKSEQQIADRQSQEAREVKDFRAMDRHASYATAMQKMHQRINDFARNLYRHDVSQNRESGENARLHNDACDSERKISVVVAHCEHPIVAHDRDGGATCSKCGKDLGWFCNISSKHFCEYEGDECCIHCGAPEERQ